MGTNAAERRVLRSTARLVRWNDLHVLLLEGREGCGASVQLALQQMGWDALSEPIELGGGLRILPARSPRIAARRESVALEESTSAGAIDGVDVVVLLRWLEPDGVVLAECTAGEVRLGLLESIVETRDRAQALAASRTLDDAARFVVEMGDPEEAAGVIRNALDRVAADPQPV